MSLIACLPRHLAATLTYARSGELSRGYPRRAITRGLRRALQRDLQARLREYVPPEAHEPPPLPSPTPWVDPAVIWELCDEARDFEERYRAVSTIARLIGRQEARYP